MVNVNTALDNIASIIKQKNPSFSGLAPNSGGLFGGAEVEAISSGKTTTAIIAAGKARQSTPTLEKIFPTIKTNFSAIEENFKSIGGVLSGILNPPVQVGPGTTVPPSPGAANNQNPTAPPQVKGVGDQALEFLDGFKDFLGPVGVFVGAGLIALAILRRR